ncbi:alpha-L-fucosidase [Fastidiosipila sanguinis]|uniref:alpha-L-fucosidase n=1 Tax=Fastidiosipila sanguinis TaxID=236753 RepID=A0A2S0KP22_9FIRM|nr:alpha-L-fucosidase [Fastidiosipila sanguinis]AVM42749.1 alpha-L-fucosidase [Fastidiosipila sanguinis]
MDYQEYMRIRDERTREFMKDRFGLFIHWGLYAIPARGEWYMTNHQIPRTEYEKYAEEWNPYHFDAKEWAKLAKEAGMKYAVITTKHHDGFCLFDSKLTDYKSTNTPFGRDIIREFVDAFRAEGLKVGFYYSLLDWHHPDYPVKGDQYHPERNHEGLNENEGNFPRYLDYLHGQVEELMSNYGKIDLLWFDFSYGDKFGEAWRGTELLDMIRSKQPDIIVNGRLEGSGETHGSILSDEPSIFSGDFANPEMIIPPAGMTTDSGRVVPWEACLTINNSWGYNAWDRSFKSSEQLVRKLVECVSKNGNMLLNVGPNAKGEIQNEQKQVLKEIGEWMHNNSDSIYGCAASDLEKPEWGRFTQKGNTIYAHIFEEPIGPVIIQNFDKKIKKIRRVRDGLELHNNKPWNAANGYDQHVFIDYVYTDELDKIDSVIAIEVEE